MVDNSTSTVYQRKQSTVSSPHYTDEEVSHFIDSIIHRHELWRDLLYPLVSNSNEILRLLALDRTIQFLRCHQMPEFVLIIDHLVLYVQRPQKNVHTHVVGS